MTAPNRFLVVVIVLLWPVLTATGQQTLFTIEDASGTVVLRVLDNGTVETDGLDLQGGPGSLTCDSCIGPGVLGDEAVHAGAIVAGAVNTMAIADGAVDEAALGDGAVSTNKLADDAVMSNHIADGQVLPEHVGPGLYSTKTQLDHQVASIGISLVTSDEVTASCADANDLPLYAGCPGVDAGGDFGLRLKGSWQSDWTDDTVPASITCRYRNNSTTEGFAITAEILCIPVP